MANEERTPNPYLDQLATGLRARGHRVTCSSAAFFRPARGVDVVHVHWPEGLAEWRPPSDELVSRVDAAADGWAREGTVLVATRHNEVPHLHDGDAGRHLYAAVYRRVAGIIHLGEASLRQVPAGGPPAVVIPHGLYAHAAPMERIRARAELGLGDGVRMVLCYGAIRNFDEQRLLSSARALSGAGAEWIVPRWDGATRPSARRRPLRRLAWWLLDRRARRWLRTPEGVVEEERERVLFSAADLVVVPRIRALNSGVVPLAFSYGKAVAGPRVGNIEEILVRTGNPVFAPGDPRSVADAVRAALDRDLEALGAANRRYALSNWGWDDIVTRHEAFMAGLVRGA